MLSITAVASSLPWRYKNNKMQNELKKENFKFYPIKDSELEGHKKSRIQKLKTSQCSLKKLFFLSFRWFFASMTIAGHHGPD